ncbi:DUF899 domain-containing protein [Parasphingorhabdus pacifica]
MTTHRIGTHEEWQAARDELLTLEKELTRRNDELARRRRELPWVPVEKDYRFDTSSGPKALAELFQGCSQLLVYHFMFGPAYEAGCPSCSSIADTIDPQVVHLRARDVTMICASRAPLEELRAYQRRMGWSFNWVSTHDSDFGFDFGFSHTPERVQTWMKEELPADLTEGAAMSGTDPADYMAEVPALMAFALSDGVVFHTYTTTYRGLEPLMAYYALLDRAPFGRNEDGPRHGWLRRHDEYEHGGVPPTA